MSLADQFDTAATAPATPTPMAEPLTCRRRPATVHALRITADNIPAAAQWIQHRFPGLALTVLGSPRPLISWCWAGNTQVARPGVWVVIDDQRLRCLEDAEFRRQYELDQVEAPHLGDDEADELGLDVIDLGELILQFGLVQRATYHPDGVSPESDTTHTVMLAMVACALAERLYPGQLDLGEVAQLALVHDLPEAHCGDTPTLRIDDAGRAAKAQREAAAAARITARYADQLPWVAQTLTRYEDQSTPEARFVRAVDKVLPKITHILNGGATITEQGFSVDDLDDAHRQQLAEIAAYAGQFTSLLTLYSVIADRACTALAEHLAPAHPGPSRTGSLRPATDPVHACTAPEGHR